MQLLSKVPVAENLKTDPINPFRHKVKRVTYIQAGHLMPRFLSCNIFKSINDNKINETPSSAKFYE